MERSADMSDENAKAKKDAAARAAKYNEEQKSGGTNAPAPADILQEIADKKAREAAEKAPTTKSRMGKVFKAGGSVSSASRRADGCATKGKTKGKML